MWMMPLHLHVNQKSDYDMIMMVSVAEKAGLNLTLSETLKTSFVAARPIL